MTEKILVFDMDGTLADFYGVNGWLEYLNESNPTPYIIAEPLYDMVVLTSVLNILKTKGWKIVVTSWLAKDSTKDFDKEVRQAKREWLKEYNFPFDYQTLLDWLLYALLNMYLHQSHSIRVALLRISFVAVRTLLI